MTTKMRSLRNFRNPIGCLILLAAFAAAGCSTANTTDDVVVNHVDASGNSVPGWVTPTGGSHAKSATMNYIANGGTSSCTECHGSDLAGGISKVSCFGNPAGCHHDPVAPWFAASPATQNHGVSAKKAPGSSGFASCQICHGADFRTVRGGSTCFTCHTTAPHAPRPWHGGVYTHANTDTANAPVCAQCHYPNSPNNPANHPATPAPAGTAPGCFNSTLCHGEAGHPAGWVAVTPAPQPHGNTAKAADGFTGCQTCHGASFTGTLSSGNVSCFNNAACHGATATWPHAPAPWRTSAGSIYTHTTTVETGNAGVCVQCHFPNSPNNPAGHPATPAPAGTAPGCFNNTLCHGEAGHPAGWVAVPTAPQPHGTAAKAANGFPDCGVCHGASFAGSGAAVSCLNTAGCHGAGVSSPHPPRPWDNAANYTHTNTSTSGSPGNLSVCANCHRNGANLTTFPAPSPPAPAGTAPGCFNSTLCHGAAAVAHPVPYNDASHYAVTSTTFTGSCGGCHDVSAPSAKAGPVCQTCHVAASPLAAASCTSCHASPPNGGAPAGAAYANIAGAHGVHIAMTSAGTPISCDTCHNGLGTNTLNHYNAAKSRVAPGDAAFLATYNAQSGASSFNSAALSCSNVSCHGGQATPNWQTGAINVNTQCTNCHAQGGGQYNSYNSGQHGINSDHSTCTNCHNTTTLAVNHFTSLSTTAMEGPASATIGGAGTSIPAGNYNAGSCTPSCHGNETW